MNIGIIDADLIGRSRHRFPNLASMKIAGWHKSKGDKVELLLNYYNLSNFDIVYISKVFTDTKVPDHVLEMENVKYGGTGFFYDKAEPLPLEIEHHMPFYDLYDNFIEAEIKRGIKAREFDEYKKYSIGFTTRGCFRGCKFCINQNSKKVECHSALSEFIDPNRPYICLLDDNILGYKDCEKIFNELNETGKRFKYKQGMDERILTEKKIQMLLNSNYIGDMTFAFDNIKDKDVIIKKLNMWRKFDNSKALKFYVLCGFDESGAYDNEFWIKDIADTFERISILSDFKCIPYIMRYEKYVDSTYRGIYITLARWCNQPSFFKKKSFREFCIANGENSSSMKYLNEFEFKYPDIAKKYFDMKYEKTQIEKVRLGNIEAEQIKWVI